MGTRSWADPRGGEPTPLQRLYDLLRTTQAAVDELLVRMQGGWCCRLAPNLRASEAHKKQITQHFDKIAAIGKKLTELGPSAGPHMQRVLVLCACHLTPGEHAARHRHVVPGAIIYPPIPTGLVIYCCIASLDKTVPSSYYPHSTRPTNKGNKEAPMFHYMALLLFESLPPINPGLDFFSAGFKI